MSSARVGMRLTSQTAGFRAVADRLDDLSPVMKKAVALIRDSVAREFLNRAWYPPEGGSIPWTPLVPFGNRRNGSEKPLIDTGALFEALMGQGPGGFVQIGPRSVSVGVSASAFPYAKLVRGGTGANIRLSPWIIRPRKAARGRSKTGARRWAMFWFLGFTYDVWLTEATLERGLRLKPRPFMTANPELERRLARMAEKYVTKGQAA